MATIRALAQKNTRGTARLKDLCAQAWRYHPDDFKVRSNTIAKHGQSALPPGTDIQDWPISYEDLEPYYDRVEYTAGVSGKAGNIKGTKIEGGNVFEGPRNREYPMPPLPGCCVGGIFESAAKKLGYHPFPQAAGIATATFNNRPACTYCGWCCFFGCHIDAKSSPQTDLIPMAVATGNLDVRPLSRVTKLNADSQGNVTSVSYLDAGGVAREQTAKVFVIASYTYENVRLLLLSKSDIFPNGLANNNGMVGKYYFGHGNWSVNGILPPRLNRFTGPQTQGVVIDDFNADNFDHSGLGFIRGTYMFSGNQLTPISGASTLAPGTPAWGAGYKDFIRKNFNHIGSITSGGSAEILPYDANFLDLDPNVKDDIGLPVIRITHDIYDNEKKAWAYLQTKAEEIMKEMGATTIWKPAPGAARASTHAQGGTRMGDDPKRSVVDKWCRCHEVPNLFIFGGSVHVTTTSFNPTTSIQAIAWRGSDEIARQLK